MTFVRPSLVKLLNFRWTRFILLGQHVNTEVERRKRKTKNDKFYVLNGSLKNECCGDLHFPLSLSLSLNVLLTFSIFRIVVFFYPINVALQDLKPGKGTFKSVTKIYNLPPEY